MDRGRLTIPDVVYLLAALLVMAALSPMFMSVLNSSANYLSRGEQLLLLAVTPLLLLVMLTLYFVKAIGGRGY